MCKDMIIEAIAKVFQGIHCQERETRLKVMERLMKHLMQKTAKSNFSKMRIQTHRLSLVARGGSRYELTPIGPKSDWKWKNVIYSGEKEVKGSPVIENKSPMIENSFPNGTPRSKRVDVRA